MTEQIRGAASAPDFHELSRIEEELLESVNQAYRQFGYGSKEYAQSVRNLNDFVLMKPVKRGELVGLE